MSKNYWKTKIGKHCFSWDFNMAIVKHQTTTGGVL